MFDELGVTVVGISTDDVKSQAQFVEEQELGFELLSDPDRSASAKYGVLSQRGWANRVTFIIDEEGILRHIDKQVNVRSHGEDLAQTIARLQSE